MLVGDQRLIEVWALFRSKQPAECWQSEWVGALRERADGNLESEPQIPIAVVMPPAQRPLAQAGDGIPLLGYFSLLIRGFRRVQQIPLFHGEEEKHPVHQAQQLLEILFIGKCSRGQGIAQSVVRWVLQEAVAKLAQCFGNPLPEIFADALAGLVGLAAPGFDNAAAGLVVHGLEAAGVGGEPKRGEVGIEFLPENEVEVGLEGGGAGQACVVAQ